MILKSFIPGNLNYKYKYNNKKKWKKNINFIKLKN